MIELGHLAAVLALLGAGVVYGTDVFCALVLRPALARVDDATLVTVTGRVHRFGDRRMPAPGIVGLAGAAVAAVLAAVSGDAVAAVGAGIALVLLVAWLVVYLRVSAPINRRLTAAAEGHRDEPDPRALQAAWDRVIVPRAALQGLAMLALCLSLIG